ncbi:N-6 DNA methylase [Streptomyces luteolus]|uniref:N-6 DNA methylase n=1 Tax=Streptomyces luteolus TaxID=3043615 RepID=A0ABT6SWY8_9ACTN|nr:N-6 DNA methylase [Streptomyces sp. B-S-A12]MDI3420122.1 N-6 DNA methylase [Streptomyces sp. B-S-A12]
MSDPVASVPGQPDGLSAALVTGAEIARLAGVTRAAVSNWRRRYGDFPPAQGGSASSPLFAWPEVRDWLERRNKSQEVSLEVQTWQALRAAYGDSAAAGVAAVAAHLLKQAGGGDAEAVALTYGPQGAEVAAASLPEAAASAVDRLAAESTAAEALEALVERLTDSARRSGSDQFTAPRILRAVAHFAPDSEPGQSVLDPACGIGSLLHAVQSERDLIRAGQDVDADSIRIARVRSMLSGGSGATFVEGDSLRADGFPSLQADLVVCDPPVAVTDWGREALLIDPRWEFGTPSRAEGELAWLQHAYAHTAPGGHVLMVMPASVAYRKAGRRIRAELVRRGAVRKVVALPGGVASAHSLPVHLWLLHRPVDATERPATVTFVDLSGNAPDGSLEPTERQRAEIPLIDLLDDDVDLTPAARMPVGRGELAAEFEQARAELVSSLQELDVTAPRLRPTEGADLWGGATVSVADLVRAGLVELGPEGPAVTGDQIDADYLEGFLQSGPNLRRTTSQSGTYRADHRGSRIPQLDPAEQRRYGEAFRALREAEAQAERLALAARRMVEIAREGLGSGTLEPWDDSAPDRRT